MEYPPGLCSLQFSLLTDLGLMVVIQGEIVQRIQSAINTRLRFWKESSREVCILALLALLIWLSFGEKWVFWLLLKNRACFWYGLGTMCSSSLQSPTVFPSSILMCWLGRNSTPRMHMSALPCVCNSRVIVCVCVWGKSVILSPGRGIHFIKGNCVHLFSSYHLQSLASLTEISMNVAIPRVRGMTSYFPNCVIFDIYPQTRTETRPKKSPVL